MLMMVAALLVLVVVDALPLEIVTENGGLQGNFIVAGVNQYLGIPYAAAPVGNLRFKPPQPHANWSGTRDATYMRAACAQRNTSSYTFPYDTVFDEDCLTLNIWTPTSVMPDSKLPVSVWIHGGGLTQGSNVEYRERGQAMVSQGYVINININYRLGVLGFLSLPALARENATHPTSGNYGLLDQRAALQWIQRNIALFGGDPSKVTIFGESAGGSSVLFHMVMPGSYGLYSRIISQSAAIFAETVTQQVAEAAGAAVAAKTKCTNTDESVMLQCLRAQSWQSLILNNDFSATANGMIDGRELPMHPFKAFLSGAYNSVPLIAGNVLNEGAGWAYALPTLSNAAYTQMVRDKYSASDADRILAVYPCNKWDPSEKDCRTAYSWLFGDAFLTCPNMLIAELVSAQRQQSGKNDVYAYTFTHAPSWMPRQLGAYHSSEIEFVYGTLAVAGKKFTNDEKVLSDNLVQYWNAFIKTANPNWVGAPLSWPVYSASTNNTRLMADVKFTTQQQFERSYCDFWSTMYPRVWKDDQVTSSPLHQATVVA